MLLLLLLLRKDADGEVRLESSDEKRLGAARVDADSSCQCLQLRDFQLR